MDNIKSAVNELGISIIKDKFITIRQIESFMKAYDILKNKYKKENTIETEAYNMDFLTDGIFDVDKFKQSLMNDLNYIASFYGKMENQNSTAYLFQNIKHYIDSNYYKSISLETLSAEFGVSTNYLSKLFRENGQIGFSDYLTERRISKACELIRNGTAVSKIYFMVGYDDPKYFIRVFKKKMGITPSQFKNNV